MSNVKTTYNISKLEREYPQTRDVHENYDLISSADASGQRKLLVGKARLVVQDASAVGMLLGCWIVSFDFKDKHGQSGNCMIPCATSQVYELSTSTGLLDDTLQRRKERQLHQAGETCTLCIPQSFLEGPE